VLVVWLQVLVVWLQVLVVWLHQPQDFLQVLLLY
jgi:hypothetical protein